MTAACEHFNRNRDPESPWDYGVARLSHAEPRRDPATLARTHVTTEPQHSLVIISGVVGYPHLLYSLHGSEQDHLGIAVAAAGDLDGDHVPDFLLGGMQNAYVGWGPGFVRACSGRDGHVLYEVDGTNEKTQSKGDAFGHELAVVGDVDRDGVNDFIVGASRWNDRGFVKLYSGRNGKEISSWIGKEQMIIGGFGEHLAALGDLDRDGVREFAVGDTVYSAQSHSERFRLGQSPYTVLGAVGDVDGDGVADLLAAGGEGGDPRDGGVCLFSGKNGHEFQTFESVSKSVGHELRFDDRRLVGDIDGDGIADFADVTSGSHIVHVWSGRTGAFLHSWEEQGSVDDTFSLGDIGDIDGDGHADLWIHRVIASEHMNIVKVLSGKDRSLIAAFMSSEDKFGERVANIGDVDGNGPPELLVTAYESGVGARCGGSAYVISFYATASMSWK